MLRSFDLHFQFFFVFSNKLATCPYHFQLYVCFKLHDMMNDVLAVTIIISMPLSVNVKMLKCFLVPIHRFNGGNQY